MPLVKLSALHIFCAGRIKQIHVAGFRKSGYTWFLVTVTTWLAL